MNDRERVLRVVQDIDHPVLNRIFFHRLRDYQLDYLLDFSRKRLCLKGRRLGLTEVDALDTVFTSSGFWEVLTAPVKAHNVNAISKRDKESKDYVRRATRWVKALSVDCADRVGADVDQDFRSYFTLSRNNDTFITFDRSGWLVQSDTQSEGAGRGQEGHLKKDEAAHYRYARQIVAGADKIPLSSDDLRISEFSTPNGTEGAGEVFHLKWTDTRQFGDYSRHKVDIYRAIEDGFPISVEQARASCLSEEEFQQEFCCKFLGSANSYFQRDLLTASRGTPPARDADMTVVGIDVASVTDLTAVVVLRRYGAAIFVEECYLIRGVPYATGAQMGQEDIVAGLLWNIDPDAAIIDASADGAQLYGRLIAKGVGPLAPHSFHSNGRQYKEKWVPQLRQALEDGTVQTACERPSIFVSGAATAVSRETAATFVDVAFTEHHFDALTHDFLRIRRKLLQSGVTFDSPRDESGHGDSFWAALMAFSMVQGAQAQREQSGGAFKQLVDASLSSGSQMAGSDYQDYL